MNHEGKQEAIDHKVILNTLKFLSSSDYQTWFNASHVLMSCTVNLDGKKQAVNCVDTHDNPLIIQKMIERLYDKEPNLWTNIKQGLIYISELPLGFDKVIHELWDKIELLDEVFEEKGLKTLVHLLPKIEHYDDPLNLD